MAYRSGFPLSPAGVPGIFSLRREIDRLFEDAFDTQGGSRASSPSFTPAADAREDAREITLHLDLPGVRPEDVDISVENGLLTVRGQRHQQRKEGQDGRYHFVERSYGSFTRAFQLPQGVDETQIRADFEHGELLVHVPKPALPQPRKVQIGVGGASATGAQVNGAQTNGTSMNGAQTNGAQTNRAQPNGAQTNGAPTNGAPTNGASAPEPAGAH